MSCEIILFLPLHGTGCTGNTSPDFLSCDDASNTLILLGRFKSKSETKLKNVFFKKYSHRVVSDPGKIGCDLGLLVVDQCQGTNKEALHQNVD